MLKGETFSLQTFTSEAFALFIDRFANRQCGVMTGCELSNTGNSVTIGEGYFLIRGRLLRIISNVTVSSITTDGYYSLICEIDLSKTNTLTEFNQGAIKVISGVNDYPSLTQQDITDDGTVYQYEFARFRVSSGSITDFTDKRTSVNYGDLYELIANELASLENQSNVRLKSDFAVLTGTITLTNGNGTKTFDYPSGFTQENCVPIAGGTRYSSSLNRIAFGSVQSSLYTGVYLNSSNIALNVDPYESGVGPSGTYECKVVLMKIS